MDRKVYKNGEDERGAVEGGIFFGIMIVLVPVFFLLMVAIVLSS